MKLLLALLLLPLLAHAQTPSCSAVITCQPLTAPVTIPPPAGVTWGYFNGQWAWAGDFTQAGTSVNYKDTTGVPLSGQYDILFISGAPWGLWLPYFASGSAGYLYPNPGWTSLTISIKPKAAGQSFAIYFERTGDIDPGCHLDISKYGPVPVAGKWGTYTVPLKDLCLFGDPTLYKMGLQDQSGKPASWWVDNVGFM